MDNECGKKKNVHTGNSVTAQKRLVEFILARLLFMEWNNLVSSTFQSLFLPQKGAWLRPLDTTVTQELRGTYISPH